MSSLHYCNRTLDMTQKSLVALRWEEGGGRGRGVDGGWMVWHKLNTDIHVPLKMIFDNLFFSC